MPVFMKYDGVEGRISDADTFDFSQLTTEPTAPENVDGLVLQRWDQPDVDDGLLLVGQRWDQPVVDDGLLLPAVQDEGLEWPIGPIPEMDHGLLLPY